MFSVFGVQCAYSERCDDEARGGAEVFVSIQVLRIAHAHDAVVDLVVPIVATKCTPNDILVQ